LALVVRVVGRVERRIPASRERLRNPRHPVLRCAARRRGVAPGQLPDFFACVGVDDPAGIELRVLAGLACSVDLDLDRAGEGEAGLQKFLAAAAAVRHDRASLEIAARAVGFGAGEQPVVGVDRQPEVFEARVVQPVEEALPGVHVTVLAGPVPVRECGIERFVRARGQPHGAIERARAAASALGRGPAQLPDNATAFQVENPRVPHPGVAPVRVLFLAVPHRRNPRERAALMLGFAADRFDMHALGGRQREDRGSELARLEVAEVDDAGGLGRGDACLKEQRGGDRHGKQRLLHEP
jgi:hypothetical protein